MADDKKYCLCIHITGRVQGVCFRYDTRMEAERIGVRGWVRNRPDGSVEALIYGNAEQLDGMKKWLGHGPKMAHVDGLQTNEARLESIPIDFRII